MVEEIFEEAGIGTHVHLWAGTERASLTERVTTMMRRFNDFCLEWFGPRPSDDDDRRRRSSPATTRPP